MREPECVGTPVSFLRLERFVLGELSGDEARAVDEHLRVCPACRACADECAEPIELPELTPRSLRTESEAGPATLASEPPAADATHGAPELAPVARPVAPVLSHPRWQARARWAVPLSLAVAAAAVLLLMLRPETPPDPPRGIARVEPMEPTDPPAQSVGASDAATPRSDVSLSLLRERDGRVEQDPTRFLRSDRFAVEITCRPGAEGVHRVAVFQGGEWSLPFPAEDLGCGNRVRVPGAFRLTDATPADICVLWGDAADKAGADRGQLPPPAELSEATCRRVEPVTPPNLR